MATQVQNRRGTTAEHSTFTGAVGEVTIDTDKDTAVVHDGSTAGGNPLMREDGSNSALALGSAGSPSLKWDANTGLYSPGADQVAISTNGTGRLFVDANGNLLVGANANSGGLGERVSINGAGLVTQSAAQTNRGLFGTFGGSTQIIGAFDNIPLEFRTNNTERLRITSDGKVGVGTSSPGTKLHIGGETNPVIRINTSENGDTWSTTSDYGKLQFFSQDYEYGGGGEMAAIAIGVNNVYGGTPNLRFYVSNPSGGAANPTERMRLDSSGRLGVGTTTPNVTGFSSTVTTINVATGSNGGLELTKNNVAAGHFTVEAGASNDIRVGAVGGSAALTFQTAGNERARIDSSGRLGIGTSAPASLLHVQGTSGTYPTTIINHSQINTEGEIIRIGRTDQPTRYHSIYAQQSDAVTSSYLQFRVHSGGSTSPYTQQTTVMTLNGAGNVGIGTTSPDTALTVLKNSNADFTSNATLRASSLVTFDNSQTTTAIVFKGSTTNPDKFIFADNNGGTQSFGLGHMQGGVRTNSIACTQNGNIIFNRSGSENGRWDSSGRLLVGTSSWSTNATLVAQGNSGGSTSRGVIYLALGANNPADGTALGHLEFSDSGGGRAAQIISARDGGTWTSGSSHPGRLVFSTTADGASSPTERIRISNNGAFDAYTNSNANFSVRCAGTGAADSAFIVFNGASSTSTGTAKFVIRQDGDCENSNNSYGALSDAKLKENIVDAASQWDDIKALQVRKYNLKKETGHQTHTQIGLIAQEVELISPGLVSESPDRDEDGNDLGTVTKSVNYSVLYMKAVKALQEAMERIEQLEAEMAEVKAQLL